MITSASNPKLRYVRRLQHRAFRAREARVVLEGRRLVADALDAGAAAAFVLVTLEAAAEPTMAPVLARLEAAGTPIWPLESALLATVTDTATPPGILAVVAAPALAWPAGADLVLILDGVRDPGNLGSALRSALAAGVDGVLLAPGTVDPGLPRALRAGTGAQFRLPVAARNWATIHEWTSALHCWVADAGGDADYTDLDWRAPSAIVIGGEAGGPSPTARAAAAGTVRIPVAAGVESLNAAQAATVLVFEAARQRRPLR